MLFYVPISENQLDGSMSNGIPSGATLYGDLSEAKNHGDVVLNIDARRIDESHMAVSAPDMYQYSLDIPSSLIVGYQRK